MLWRDSVIGLPNRDQEADEIFYKQLGEVLQSLPFVLVVSDLKLADVCRENDKVDGKKYNFLEQLVSKPAREGSLLDLFANRGGLVGDMMVGNCLGQ